jgi:hypothetical protein
MDEKAEGPGFRGLQCGGDEENRTLNPCLAKAVLCQLSYVPWYELILAGTGADQPASDQDSERVASFHTSVLLWPFFFLSAKTIPAAATASASNFFMVITPGRR